MEVETSYTYYIKVIVYNVFGVIYLKVNVNESLPIVRVVSTSDAGKQAIAGALSGGK